MRKIRVAAAALTIVLGPAGLAHADGFITPYLGFNTGGASGQCITLTNCEDKRLNFGVSLGVTNGILGFEEDIGYAPKFFGDVGAEANGVLTAMSNLLVIVPAGPIRPYGLFGLGLIQPHFQFSTGSFELKRNALGYDVGGGINLFFTPGVGLRGDVRHIQTFKDNFRFPGFNSDRVDFWRASAGLTFKF